MINTSRISTFSYLFCGGLLKDKLGVNGYIQEKKRATQYRTTLKQK